MSRVSELRPKGIARLFRLFGGTYGLNIRISITTLPGCHTCYMSRWRRRAAQSSSYTLIFAARVQSEDESRCRMSVTYSFAARLGSLC